MPTTLQHGPRERKTSRRSSNSGFPELPEIKPFREERWEERWAAGRKREEGGGDGWVDGRIRGIARQAFRTRIHPCTAHTRCPSHVHTCDHVHPHMFIHETNT